MRDSNNTDGDLADKSVHYLKGVNIYAPVYLIDDVGLSIFVDNFDTTPKFELPYYDCTALVDTDLDKKTTEKTLKIK